MTEKTATQRKVDAIRELLGEHYRLITEKAEREINDKISLLGWKVTLPRYPESIDEGPAFFTALAADADEQLPEGEVPEEVRETYHKICDKYDSGDYKHEAEIEAAIEELEKTEKEGPRQPNGSEMAQLVEAYTAHYGENGEDAQQTLQAASIAVWPAYMTGGPGYCGKVFMVVYDGAPSFFDVFTEEHDMSQKPWPKTGKLKKEERE